MTFSNLPQRDPQILIVRPRDKPEADPVGTVLVSYRESLALTPDYERGEAFFEIRLSLITASWARTRMPCQWGGSFKCRVAPDEGEVRVTNGAVFLDLEGMKGLGIGTFAMNEIVGWAKQWPMAAVHPISLSSGEGYDSNRERRNRFYERFGFIFDYSEDRSSGTSLPMKSSALKRVEPPSNITVMPVSACLHDVLQENESLKRSMDVLRSDRRKVEAAPFRWLFNKYWFKYGHVLIIAVVALLLLFALFAV